MPTQFGPQVVGTQRPTTLQNFLEDKAGADFEAKAATARGAAFFEATAQEDQPSLKAEAPVPVLEGMCALASGILKPSDRSAVQARVGL